MSDVDSGLESIHRKEWKGWNRNDGIVKEDSESIDKLVQQRKVH
jgi:hypothetical protein